MLYLKLALVAIFKSLLIFFCVTQGHVLSPGNNLL
jgi:hypothetical protein